MSCVLSALGSKSPVIALLPLSATALSNTQAVVATFVLSFPFAGLVPKLTKPVAPSTVSAVVTPPTLLLTRTRMSPSLVALLINVFAPLTVRVRSLSVPTVRPPSLATVKIPVVVSFVSLRKNCVLSRLSSVCALVASPLKVAPLTALLNWIPGAMVANPLIAVCGVKVESLLTIPTIVSLTNNLTTTWLLPRLSVIVSTIAPDSPVILVKLGPTRTKLLPL